MARGETLAFVIPWFGPDIPGGAEAVCRDAARALAERGVSVEILTTCARDHASDWIDHHPPGLTAEMGLPVRRFTVRPRDARRFNELNERLLRGELLASWEEREFVANSIHSDDLYAYLAAERDRYRYAFIPYCFGTTWEGALVAPDRSAVIACLHDEPYARLAATRRVLRDAGAVCFHAGAERALAEALVGPAPDRFGVVGGGVETRIAGDAARFRQKYGLEDPFLLYAGRKSREKNIPLLVEYFTGYRLTHRDTPLKLALIGPGRLRVSERLAGDVLDLGLLPPEGPVRRLRRRARTLPALDPRELLSRDDGGVALRHPGAGPRRVSGDPGALSRLERRALLLRLLRVRWGGRAAAGGRQPAPRPRRQRAGLRPRELHLGPSHRQLPRDVRPAGGTQFGRVMPGRRLAACFQSLGRVGPEHSVHLSSERRSSCG